jgi:hypothetical protein
MDRACNTNGGEEECIWVIVGKARRKKTTRKTKTYILKWIIERQNGVIWTGLMWLRIWTSEGLL